MESMISGLLITCSGYLLHFCLAVYKKSMRMRVNGCWNSVYVPPSSWQIDFWPVQSHLTQQVCFTSCGLSALAEKFVTSDHQRHNDKHLQGKQTDTGCVTSDLVCNQACHCAIWKPDFPDIWRLIAAVVFLLPSSVDFVCGCMAPCTVFSFQVAWSLLLPLTTRCACLQLCLV